MDQLLKGVRRFRTDVYPRYRDMFQRLAAGQNPELMVITCSDSRLVLRKLFGTNFGEVFVLRTAGLVIPEHNTALGGEQATIEYAVKVLKVKDIIVLGHSDCGAMKTLLNPPENLSVEMPAVSHILSRCGTDRKAVSHIPEPDKALEQLTQMHVRAQLDRLCAYPFVDEKILSGELAVHGWLFDIAHGLFHRYERKDAQFVVVSDQAD